MTNLFWIRSPNFGDALNPVLHKAITGREPVWAEATEPHTVLALGSLVHCARPGNILWGTGAMADDMELQCNHTTIAEAVRGPLTAWLLRKQGVDVSNTIFADPAILVPLFFPQKVKETDKKILVVPHYADCERAIPLAWGEKCLTLHPMKDIELLIRSVSEADTVITSSLHILIVAEAFGIPAIWVEFSDSVRGKGFKFWDWYLSTIRNPPAPIQIRGNTIPWKDIYNSVFDWVPPKIDLKEHGEALLSICPFDMI